MARFVVDTAADVVDENDGRLSLREAIEAANDAPGLDEIVVSPRVWRDIELTSSLPEVTDSIVFDGGRATLDLTMGSAFSTSEDDISIDLKNFTVKGESGGTLLSVSGDNVNATVDRMKVDVTPNSSLIRLNGEDNHLTVSDTKGQIQSGPFVSENGAFNEIVFEDVDLIVGGTYGATALAASGDAGIVTIMKSDFESDNLSSYALLHSGEADFQIHIERSSFSDFEAGGALYFNGWADSVDLTLLRNTFDDNDHGLFFSNVSDLTFDSMFNRFRGNEVAIEFDSWASGGTQLEEATSRFDMFINNDTAIQNDASTGAFVVRTGLFLFNEDNVLGTGETDIGFFA